jgi:hypothetical protein
LAGGVCIGVIGAVGVGSLAARPGRFWGFGEVDPFEVDSASTFSDLDGWGFVVDLRRRSMKTVEPVVRDMWNRRTGNGSVGRAS